MDKTVAPKVEFYWRPGCPYCKALRFRLHLKGISLAEVNIWEDPVAAARVRSVADGNETVPTIFIGPISLVNPNPKQVVAAMNEYAGS